MSREIKFRAWDKREKYMAYDVHDIYDDNKLHPCRSFGEVLTEKMDYETEELRFKVMQYTGLKDKNGTEIYEGDVVEVLGYYQRYFVVEYLTNSFKLLDGKDGFIGEICYWNGVEVIGNRFENPELLEDSNA
jgi:uncharacterized phage protein (TIGR01671 family)